MDGKLGRYELRLDTLGYIQITLDDAFVDQFKTDDNVINKKREDSHHGVNNEIETKRLRELTGTGNHEREQETEGIGCEKNRYSCNNPASWRNPAG